MIPCRIIRKARTFPSILPTALYLLLGMFPLFLGGCSYFNDTRLHKVLGKDTDLISFSYNIADNLIDRAMPPLTPSQPDMPVLVTTFVDSNDLKKTSRFGRLLQEHISSRMVQIGYTVREIKLARTITMEPKSGETVLSRDLSKISGEIQAQAIVAGTISRSGRMLYLSARLIAPGNSNILATYDHQLFMDDNLLAMYGLRLNDDIDTPITEPIQPPLNAIFW